MARDLLDRPLIGVSASFVHPADAYSPTPKGEPTVDELSICLPYLRAVEAAGGMPVVIPPLEGYPLDALLDRLDGLCLSGGPDMEPAGYGQEPHPRLLPTYPASDAIETALARGADERDLPTLAICRGAQVLNVAHGGTLHQHVADVAGEPAHVEERAVGSPWTHRVRVDPDSRLATVMGAETTVNSFHHQAVADLAPGLKAVAWADDGMIEAVERPDATLCMGVQWHPEVLPDQPEQRALFTALVEAAARRRASVA
jgi:putative glutamine amidotransferase